MKKIDQGKSLSKHSRETTIFFRTRHARSMVPISRFLPPICSTCLLLSRPTFREKLLEFHRPVLYRLLHDKLKTPGESSEELSHGSLAAHFPTEMFHNSSDVRAREEKEDMRYNSRINGWKNKNIRKGVKFICQID